MFMKPKYLKPEADLIQFYTENVTAVSSDGLEDMVVDKSYEYSGDVWY